jgi:small subunit ribosomal protein S8
LIEDGRQGVLRMYLKYNADEVNVISGIKRVSTPGRRVYVAKTQVPRVMGGLGTSIVSTSKGVMSDREARAAGLGGELLAQVW